MAVVTLQYSLERRKQSLAQRADRLGDFLAATYAAARGIEEIAIAPSGDKARAEVDMRSAAQDRLNDSLTRLRLFEDAETVASATRLERELTRLIRVAQEVEFSRKEWRGQRSDLAGMTHEYEI